MSSYTVCVNSTSSILRSSLFPALNLDVSKEWEVALLDFTTYNSIPNVTDGENNKFHYYVEKTKDGELKSLMTATLETGVYEIEDINQELQKQLGKNNIEIKANNNLLRSELKSKFYIDFTQENSLGSLLGFPKTMGVLKPNQLYLGKETVNIIKVNTINISCNIVHGSYNDGVNEHILHTFCPTVAPGFKIIEKPHNLVYLPVNTRYISDIELNVLDQDGNLVDFRGETVSVRIHVKAVF